MICCNTFILLFTIVFLIDNKKITNAFLIKTLVIPFYNALIDSTGFFFAAFHTGRNVATNTVTNATAINVKNDTIPNTNKDAPNIGINTLFTILQHTILPITCSTL